MPWPESTKHIETLKALATVAWGRYVMPMASLSFLLLAPQEYFVGQMLEGVSDSAPPVSKFFFSAFSKSEKSAAGGDMPWRQCPRCVLQLSDYVGGSSDNTPYVTAMNFLSNDNLDDTNEKFARVIRGIYTKHRSLRELLRPAYFSEAKQWQNIAFLYALELHHLALTVERQQRSHATGTSRRNDPWEDELEGASCPTTTPIATSDLTHTQWIRLSVHRAEAFSKRQGRRRKESGIACDEGFDLVWQKSFSPFCCPTYGSGTSLIRLAVFLPGQNALPMPSRASNEVVAGLAKSIPTQ
ncbi:hypothetical protein AK812_SmicGene17057 [Symbiodinium microadriaticum]|uniref:Uncharacterized protein n=1 Tax=Symbiodinium microadriaticum TaxID=2951 RepID=A0A1Q9DYQ8_SYMMI|nr:hypothetical protein AK812_SmicGene17057 [Symbiodinium microadriaticum]